MQTGETFVLAQGSRIVGSGYSFVYGTQTGVNVTVDGYFWMTATLGSPFYFYGGDTINIGPAARMVLTPNSSFGGIQLGTGGIGGTVFTNEGAIAINGGQGFFCQSGNNRISNLGTLTLNNATLHLTPTGASDHLFNSGLINGGTNAGGAAITVSDAGESIENTGTIISQLEGGVAISRVSFGGSAVTSIYNSGLIMAAKGTAISHAGPLFVSQLFLTNLGTITGLFDAVHGAAEQDIVRNSGTIAGNVFLYAGADIFNGIGGTVNGTVALGEGDGLYRLSDAAMTLYESAGQGNDSVESTVDFTLGSNFENLRLLGTAIMAVGNALGSVLLGNDAANVLLGLAGKDTSYGGAGDDQLIDGSGNDLFVGGGGADTLFGGVGSDSLYGGSEEDILIGGAGRDEMRGGSDGDVFVFLSLADMGVTAARADQIMDFRRGQDVIDLSAIDAISTNTNPDDAFRFIGSDAFSRTAGELRLVTAAGVSTIFLDTDGNARADAQIIIAHGALLRAVDFVL